MRGEQGTRSEHSGRFSFKGAFRSSREREVRRRVGVLGGVLS